MHITWFNNRINFILQKGSLNLKTSTKMRLGDDYKALLKAGEVHLLFQNIVILFKLFWSLVVISDMTLCLKTDNGRSSIFRMSSLSLKRLSSRSHSHTQCLKKYARLKFTSKLRTPS